MTSHRPLGAPMSSTLFFNDGFHEKLSGPVRKMIENDNPQAQVVHQLCTGG
jgi:hypothetical protein